MGLIKNNILIVTLSIIAAFVPIIISYGFNAQLLWTMLLSLCAGLVLFKMLNRNLDHGWKALQTGLFNFKDGEFSTSIAYDKQDELGQLCSLFNETAEQLRKEKQWIYQRELMLDKVLESSPQVLILVDTQGFVVFANQSAKGFFSQPNRLEGMLFNDVIGALPDDVRQVIEKRQDGIFSLQQQDAEQQMWHLATGEFLLNNSVHELYIFKQFTRELSRQEVAVWKKVIRIISHELNNSLGPISSMLHSGKILAERLNEPKLSRVFSTIDERIRHLTEFVHGYGKFAKLPVPTLKSVNMHTLCEGLHQHWLFRTSLMVDEVWADPTQLEQLLINLLKNAHESGSDPDDIELHCFLRHNMTVIAVLDRGLGMSEVVMQNALVPFYSTKNTGSGLGLALCREIAEAHHGQLHLNNRKGGGLSVEISLPAYG
ncbi:sensor histidine kinase (plasmid) [Pseudoalteromonas sp. T1lg65]|uniref:sensor histidine kinase n=1 Tax=Pseudoalteromonas sp. T1lg65 TaxID=2077101 RepID=UPI003F7A26E5